MFDIVVSDEQLKTAYEAAIFHNLGNRGYGDGDQKQQAYGIIGEIAIKDALGIDRPNFNGFDGGFDFEIDGRKVDVKTMGRTVPVRPSFVNNLMACQLRYDVDYYCFASFNTKTKYLTVCGLYPHDWVEDQAILRRKGDEIVRSNGTTTPIREDFYEIPNDKLFKCDCVADLESIITGV